MTNPSVELKILDQRLLAWGLPQYQSDMAAAIDLHACIDSPLELRPGAPAALVPSGIAVHMADPGMAALVLPRSGLGHRKGLVLGNLLPGERFAQMVFVPILRPRFEVVEAFSLQSDRGAGGFGSTGTAHGGG